MHRASHPQLHRESIELIRKLALTSILTLIAPGSAGQVVVGLLLAFFMLMASMARRPYAEDSLNVINVMVQSNLFFYLLVALLLKVNLDGTGSSTFFSGIVGALSLMPLVLPIAIKMYVSFAGNNMEMKEMMKSGTMTAE